MLHLIALGVLVIASEPEPEPYVGPKTVEARVGLAAFGGTMGGVRMSGMGLHVALEKRAAKGDLQLGIEGGYLGIGDSDRMVGWRGRMSRAAVVGRFRIIELEETPVMGAWVDVGVGVERITWARGGVLYRPELMVGMSGTVGGIWGGDDYRGRFGDFFQVHALISRGPGCAGMQCPEEIEMGVQAAVGFYFSE